MRRDGVVTRRAVIAGIGVAGMSLIGSEDCVAQEAADKGRANSSIAELKLSDPIVDIGGPFPTLLRGAKVGQLILMQISYRIATSVPKSATIDLSSKALSAVGIYMTPGEVAFLTPERKEAKIGVGFLSVFVKAIDKGRCSVTVKVTLTDDTVKDVPFEIEVK